MRVKIDGMFYDFFNEVTLSKSLDSVASSFSFSAFFDPENPVHKELFRPLSFRKVELYDEDALLLTGTITNHTFNSKATPDLVVVSGYSTGGVLEDCTIPYTAYPLESLNRTLKEITLRIIKYFGLTLIIDKTVTKECNQIIVKSVAGPEDTVKGYLSKVAAQKNVVISHNNLGQIIFFRPDVGAQSKNLYTDKNSTGMSLDVQGQGLHSTITTLRQPGKKSRGAAAFNNDNQSSLTPQDSIKNNLITAFRPTVSVLSSGTDTDTSSGSKNILASELKNIKITFDLDRWDDLEPGNIIEVMNQDLYIYKRSRLIVESVSINESSETKTMAVSAVLPESFTGIQPKNIFA